MEKITVQISKLSPAQRTALETAIQVQTTYNGSTVVVLSGADYLDILNVRYGDYKCPDIATVIPLYNRTAKDSFVRIAKVYMDEALKNPFITHDMQSMGSSDIAPATTTNTVTNPDVTEQIKKAPMDSDTVHLETETSTSVNAGIAYDANVTSVTYDKSGILHNAVTDNHTTGYTGKLITDVVQGELAIQFNNIVDTYIMFFVGKYCFMSWSDNDDD